MGHRPFFRAEDGGAAAGGIVDACIDLAMFYKCDPLIYMRLDPDLVGELYRRTMDRLAQIRPPEED